LIWIKLPRPNLPIILAKQQAKFYGVALMLKILFNRFFGIILLCCIALLSGCQSLPTVHTFYDDSADLSAYSTFSFHPQLMPEGDEYDKLSTRYIKAAIVTQMQNKGYRYAGDSDLWVNFNTYKMQKIRISDTPRLYPYYHYRDNYGVWGAYPRPETRVDQYTEGTLNIDVIDRSSKKLLWEGIAVGKLTKKTMDNLEAKINEAVALIFEKFPK
jgi:hypothetical protein